MMRPVVAAALGLLVAVGSAAQEGDGAAPAPERWGLELNVALTSASGNDQITVLVTDTKLTHLQTDALKLDWTGRIRYGRSGGEEVTQNMQSGITLEVGPGNRWSPFVFAQGEKDPFKRLDLRTSSGAGVRYKLLQRENAALTVSGAALHSYENIQLIEADPLARERTQTARSRWIGEGRYTLGELVEAKHRTYYEPLWDDAGDYLIEVENALQFHVSTRLTFRVVQVFQRDSSPPVDVEENDSLVTLGVGYRTRF